MVWNDVIGAGVLCQWFSQILLYNAGGGETSECMNVVDHDFS